MKKWSEEKAADVMAACVAGDDSGWEKLFHHCYPTAEQIASGAIFQFSKEHAEDVAQQTMIALCSAVQKRSVRNLSGFVRTVAHHKCVDLLRKNDPLRHTDGSAEGENNPEWIPDPSRISLAVAESDTFCILRQTLEEMKNPCLELLKCRYSKGASYKEIASAVSIPSTQVGVNIKRCLTKLKNLLNQQRPSFSKELSALVT